MKNKGKKEELLLVTKELLLKSDKPESVTSRQIIKEANMNLSMINYYYGSKDFLITMATNEILREEFEDIKLVERESPLEELKEILSSFSKLVIKYRSISRLAIPHILLEGDIDLVYEVLPYVEACLETEESLQLKKLIAYEIVSILQLILYRLDDFSKFISMDLSKEENIDKFIDLYLDRLLGGE